jgi:tetrahydromethanopterin S-methyltransferase subunit C
VLAGFSFAHYAPQIVAMLLGAILGSVLGRGAKNIIPEKQGVLVLKWVTTVLAIKLLF